MRSTSGIAAITTMVMAAVVAALIALAPIATPADRTQAPAICHAGTAGADLLHTTHCPAGTLTYRLGYTPEVALLPSGRQVHVEPDGTCSWIPDHPFGLDFRNACRMHDLGYDLIRVGWVDAGAKAGIDRGLRDGMRDACAGHRGVRAMTCRSLANLAWLAASLGPTPRDPDPGSFSTDHRRPRPQEQR